VVLLSDAVVIYLFTRRYDLTIGLIVATNLASTILYFMHERVWDQVQWGRKQVGDGSDHTPELGG
jgi:uncharacterized membrane protein